MGHGRMEMGFHQKPKRRSVPYPSKIQHASWIGPVGRCRVIIIHTKVMCYIKKHKETKKRMHPALTGFLYSSLSVLRHRHPHIHPFIRPVHAGLDFVHQVILFLFFLFLFSLCACLLSSSLPLPFSLSTFQHPSSFPGSLFAVLIFVHFIPTLPHRAQPFWYLNI